VTYGLTPRREPTAEEIAAVVVAAQELLRIAAPAAIADNVPAWRFSGRWFNAGRYSLRRPLRPN